VTHDPREHQGKLAGGVFPFNAAVARAVPKKDVHNNPDALRSVMTECDNLRKSGCWNDKNVQEWDGVAKAA